METIELITVVYAGDLANLYFHALSLKKYWVDHNPEKYKWTIVVEDCVTQGRQQPPADPTSTHRWCVENIVPLMWGWNVEVVDAPTIAATDGWHRQQVAKLWAAARSDKTWSLLFDCKNFLIRPTRFEDYFSNGKVLVHLFNDRPSPNPPSDDQKMACSILGLNVNSLTEAFNITPFIWKNQLVRELIDTLKINGYDIYQVRMIISEAVLYWCYAQDKVKWTRDYTPISVGQYGGCADEFCLDIDELQKEIFKLVNSKIKMLTMHRFHTTPAAFSMISSFLKGRWIVDDHNIAFYKKTFLENLHTLRPQVVEFLEPKWKPKELKRNGKTIKFDRIVAYGCSFTEGSELADFLIDPALPIAELDRRKREEKFNFYESYKHYKDIAPDITSIQKNLSWAKQLANKFGVGFENRAHGGNSMENVVFEIEKDLKSGFLTDTDFIVVGVTSPDRWMFFTPEGHAQRVMLSNGMFWPTIELYNEFILNVANDYYNLYHWYISLKFLDLLSDRLGGRLVQQYIHGRYDDYKRWTKKPINPKFVNILEEANSFNSVIDYNYSLGNYIHWDNDTHGMHHPRIEFYKQFTDHIYKKLTKEQNV
jgi:hypothetical protein